MHTFEFIRPTDSAAAIAAAAQSKTAQQGAAVRFMGGGTTLIDLMKLKVETPARVLDINRLPLDKIELMPDGGLKIGATVRNSDLAYDARVQRDYVVLSQAILNGASAQVRNMATVAGNLLQRTRCMYFRDTAMPCNKREPGSGCPAITSSNRTLAILGASEHCIATNPSDMCVAMAALEAKIYVQGSKGPRIIAFADFHLLPGSTPHRETVLESGDLTAITTFSDRTGHTAHRRPAQSHRVSAVHLGFQFPCNVVRGAGGSHDREWQIANARYFGSGENVGRTCGLSSREYREDLSFHSGAGFRSRLPGAPAPIRG